MLAFASAAFVLAASARAAPIVASLAAVEAALSTPNTTQTSTAEAYLQNGNAGACGLYSKDSDVVVGLPYEFYSELGAVSPYCGTYLVVKSEQNNMTVTARVADASATNNTLSVSQGTWDALDGTASSLETVQWRFANETETAAAKEALGSLSSSSSSSSAAYVAPSTTSSEYVVPTTTSTSEYVAPTTTSTSEYVAPSSSSTSEYVAPSSSSTTEWVAPTTTTTTSAWTPSSSSTAEEEEKAAPTGNSYSASSASSGSYSGTATYFFQGGNPGHCGTVHSDSDYIVALTSSMYGDGSSCGKTVSICSSSTGKCTSAKVADSCPTCTSSGDLDLSEATFNAIASPSDGVTSITWSFSS